VFNFTAVKWLNFLFSCSTEWTHYWLRFPAATESDP